MDEFKICPYCGKRFKLKFVKGNKKVYCSRKCYLKHYWIKKSVPREYSKESKKCVVCGNKFEKGFNFGNVWKKKQTCSRRCTNKKNYLIWKKKHPYQLRGRTQLKGEKSPSWRGGRIIDDMGYIRIKKHDHPFRNCDNYILEHRLVMEEWLREHKPNSNLLIGVDGIKYLKPKTVVHHIDLNRSNNNIKNLICFKNSIEHRSFHNKLSSFYEQFVIELVGGDIYGITQNILHNS